MIDWKSYVKVERYAPNSIEKGTLLAIARLSDEQGLGCYAKLSTLAQKTGKSVRTVRRHIRQLEERVELVTQRDPTGKTQTLQFWIPLCEETTLEAEQRTGVSKRQLKLPLVSRDVAELVSVDAKGRLEHLAACGVKLRPGTPDMLAGDPGHVGLQCINNGNFKKEGSKVCMEKGDRYVENLRKWREEEKRKNEEGRKVDSMAILKENAPEVWEAMQREAVAETVGVDIALYRECASRGRAAREAPSVGQLLKEEWDRGS